MDKYEGYSTRDLIDHHNAVASDLDERPITKWKGSKDELVRKIAEMEARRDGRPESADDGHEERLDDAVEDGAGPLPDHGGPELVATRVGKTLQFDVAAGDETAEPWEPMGETVDEEHEEQVDEVNGEADQPSGEEADQPSGEEGGDENPGAGPDFHPDVLAKLDELRAEKDPKRMTTQHRSLELLSLVVDVTEEDGKTTTWGVSYEEVVEAVKSLNPACRTSVQSQRWYNSKVKRGNEGEPWDRYEVPDRRPQSDRPEKAGRGKLTKCPHCGGSLE